MNSAFGARQRLSATCEWSWDSAHHDDVIITLPWQPQVTSQLKWPPLKRLANLTHFSNFWHKEQRVANIDIMDVYNREVGKLSQKLFMIAVMLVEKVSVIKL